MTRNHLTYLLFGGAVLLGAVVLFDVPLQSALLVAVLLACPVMMLFMMGGHVGHGAGDDEHRPVDGRDGEAGSGTSPDAHRH
jgi:hypothetical protein